jgi:hypothetical protein
MAYPNYKVTFVGDLTDLKGKKHKKIETNGSHAFVLASAATRVDVALTHESPNDEVPKIIITFS